MPLFCKPIVGAKVKERQTIVAWATDLQRQMKMGTRRART